MELKNRITKCKNPSHETNQTMCELTRISTDPEVSPNPQKCSYYVANYSSNNSESVEGTFMSLVARIKPGPDKVQQQLDEM